MPERNMVPTQPSRAHLIQRRRHPRRIDAKKERNKMCIYGRLQIPNTDEELMSVCCFMASWCIISDMLNTLQSPQMCYVDEAGGNICHHCIIYNSHSAQRKSARTSQQQGQRHFGSLSIHDARCERDLFPLCIYQAFQLHWMFS